MNQQLSTHILDLSSGKPAQGVVIKLFELKNNSWVQFGDEGITDENGRFKNFKTINYFGTFKLRFETKDYFDRLGINDTLYPFIEVSLLLHYVVMCMPEKLISLQIVFDIKTSEHYHIPLLLSPFGYSTYRGS